MSRRHISHFTVEFGDCDPAGIVLVEGREVRVFARRHPSDPSRIEAVPAPESIRRSCDG
jgi:hypothetical protein